VSGSRTFTVSLADDALVEESETVHLALGGPTGGATLGAPTSAVLTLTDNDVDLPNTPPRISDVPDQTVTIGGTSGVIPFTVSDGETPTSGLTVTAASSDPALVPVSAIMIGGAGPDRTVIAFPTAGRTGTTVITLTVADAGGLTVADTFTVNVVSNVLPRPRKQVGVQQFAVGADAGGGMLRLFDRDGTERFAVAPFAGFTGGVRTAAADFNRDGVADVVAGTGPGGPTRVLVLDGKTRQELFVVGPFEPAFTGGVYVAAGDLTGDGVADLVITPDEGGGPRVRVFDGAGFGQLADFFGIDDPNFRGGARAAVGDLNGDGVGDLVVSAGYGGGPRVAGFDGRTLTGARARLFGDFFAFEDTLRNGVYLTAGDLDGDGLAELIVGGGPGGGPRVSAFRGADLLRSDPVRSSDFFAGDTGNRGGVRVAVKDLDGDDRADVMVGAGSGAGSRVSAYHGLALSAGGAPTEAFGFEAFAGFSGGVFVG
jgi:hypothetical protein